MEEELGEEPRMTERSRRPSSCRILIRHAHTSTHHSMPPQRSCWQLDLQGA